MISLASQTTEQNDIKSEYINKKKCCCFISCYQIITKSLTTKFAMSISFYNCHIQKKHAQAFRLCMPYFLLKTYIGLN